MRAALICARYERFGGVFDRVRVLRARSSLPTVRRLPSRHRNGARDRSATARPRCGLRATSHPPPHDPRGAREGARAFTQGIAPRLATYSAVKGSLFALYDAARAPRGGLGLNSFAAGALAGAANTLVSCPQDVLKSQLQVGGGERRARARRRCESPRGRRTRVAPLGTGGCASPRASRGRRTREWPAARARSR